MSIPSTSFAILSLGALTFGVAASCTVVLGDDFTLGGGPGGHGAATGGAGTGGATGGSGTGGAGLTDCGNDTVDQGETCDGDCPWECIDTDFCTDDHMQGSPATCDASCPLPVVVNCIPNDGCCPGGCYDSIDNDCLMRVAIVSSDGNGAPWVQTALQGVSPQPFASVDVIDTNAFTPTLADLANFDALLVYTNYQGFADPIALGDVLADFHDQGGRVVVANGANCTSYALGGRFVDQGYLTLGIGPINPNLEMAVFDRYDTPLLNGVSSFESPAHCASPALEAVVVAHYDPSGDPILAYRWLDDRRRVDLNLFPTAVPVELLVNALLFQ